MSAQALRDSLRVRLDRLIREETDALVAATGKDLAELRGHQFAIAAYARAKDEVTEAMKELHG